jgi:histidinol phosphatase-like enzyme
MNTLAKDIAERKVLEQLSPRWFRVAVSNQTFIGRQSRISILQALKYRARLNELIRLNMFDAVAICHHHPDAQISYLRTNCDSRKPYDGLFRNIISRFSLDPGSCLAVGDRITDIMAASHAGIKECFLISNKQAFNLNVSNLSPQDFYKFKVAADLAHFLTYVIDGQND